MKLMKRSHPAFSLLLGVFSAMAYAWCAAAQTTEKGGGSDTEAVNPSPIAVDVFEQEKAIVLEALFAQFEESFPLPQKGDEVKVVKSTGIVEAGEFKGVEKKQVVLERNEIRKMIPLTELRAQDRVKFDKYFREEWVDVLARLQTRQQFITADRTFKRYDLSLSKPTETALRVGDPQAFYKVAKEYRGGIHRDKDLAYSFLYATAAAKQGLADARFDLGRMFIAGAGTLPNKRSGLQWIAAAASQDHKVAQKYLERHRISQESAKQAAAAQREALLAEQEAQARRLEAYQRANENRVIIRGKKTESSFNKL